jgi:16S rRNA processing protein RimM
MSAPLHPGDAEREWIAVARILRPQGRHGEVIAELLTDFPERFTNLKTVRAIRPAGEIGELELERAWLHKGRVVLKFAGYETIDQAEALRGARLVVGPSELIELPDYHYYDFDLVDCEVVTREGEPLGRVTEVLHHGAAPLLMIQNQGREYLIPLALDICTEIDIARKRIVIEPPEGLLEL